MSAAADRDELDGALARLSGSTFRRRFRLGARERAVIEAKGLTRIREHADRLIADRLAPALPRNDGKQTPMRGHPVFVAQHATATCCRGCLAKWHGIRAGRALTVDERAFVVALIGRWLDAQLAQPAVEDARPVRARIRRKAANPSDAEEMPDLFAPPRKS